MSTTTTAQAGSPDGTAGLAGRLRQRASRARRLAVELERRVRFCEPVWRYGYNLRATRDHVQHPPALGPEAARVLADLRRDGYAVTDLARLTGDDSLLARVRDRARQLEQDLGSQPRADKPFLIEVLDPVLPEVHPEDLLAQVCAHPQLKGVADAYFGLSTRVANLNVWRNLPLGEAPRSSQLWHRDLPEDRIVLKAFLYLEDCPPEAGPFTYAEGTHRLADAQLGLAGATHDGMNFRVLDEDSAELLQRKRELAGGAGTLVLADTGGFHRGGWATAAERYLLQVRYASRASRSAVGLSLPPGVDGSAWSKTFAFRQP